MDRNFNKKLVLEDGSQYLGYGFGADCDAVCELVFNTAMAGYQDIVTDPAYTYQAVAITYPIIGSYGMANDNYETKRPRIAGLVVNEYNNTPSNFRATTTLGEVLEEYGIPGIEGIDTRKLTRNLRDTGTKRCIITSADTSKEKALEIIANTPVPTDAVATASCKRMWKSVVESGHYHVVVIDCGIRYGIVRDLNKKGFNLTIVPHDATVEQILKQKPDGIFISDGPGDPKEAKAVIDLIKALKGKLPIFGIGLGNQLISLAYGADTYKLKAGHRGSNHPVRNLETNKLEVVTQSHSYTVDVDTLKNTDLEITHINTIDNTVEGVECKKDKIFAVQYLPTTTNDGTDLYDKFISYMKEAKANA